MVVESGFEGSWTES